MTQLYDCRDAFTRTLEELAHSDPRIVAVCNDSVGSSKLGSFRKAFPTRLINVGIAEQNMVGIGAGLANGGKLPFVCGAACFITGRALEQVKVDVGYSRANVKLCGMSSGVAYGELGPTHQSIEDLAWTRAIANLTVIVPADPMETEQATRVIAATPGPVFLRLSRMGVPQVHPADYRFEIGRAAVLREGADVTLIANGVMVTRAIDAAAQLAEQGIQATVLNAATVQPLDETTILAAAARTRAVVTMEEATIRGGLGGAVAELLSTRRPTPMRILGAAGFAPTGSIDWLLEHFGLSVAAIVTAARELIAEKSRP